MLDNSIFICYSKFIKQKEVKIKQRSETTENISQNSNITKERYRPPEREGNT